MKGPTLTLCRQQKGTQCEPVRVWTVLVVDGTGFTSWLLQLLSKSENQGA